MRIVNIGYWGGLPEKGPRPFTTLQIANDRTLPTARLGAQFRLALLALPDKTQQLVEAGTLAPRTAYEITKLRESDDQLEVAKMVVNQDLDVRATVKLVRLKNRQASTRKKKSSPQEKTYSENQILLERQSESEGGSFHFLLHQHNHPSGHITSILKADREDVPFIEQINTLQAHILVLKRAYNEKKGV